MRIPLPRLRLRRSGDEAGEEREEREERLVIESKPKEETGAEQLTKKFKNPSIIFVGSNKGGVGKSFISSTLVHILAAHNERPVYAVDSDLDNSTLSMVLMPESLERTLQAMLAKRNVDYLNFADVLLEGVITKRQLLKFRVTTQTCGGTLLPVYIRLVPTFHALKKKSQMVALSDVDVFQMREGMDNLIEYVSSKNGIMVIDGKQKSNLHVNLDPIYSVAKERSDVILLVTDPLSMNFDEITAQYRDFLDKVVIVVNKVERSAEIVRKLKILIKDAVDNDVPVFIVPKSEEDAERYVRQLVSPGRVLGGKVSRYVGAVAVYLGLVESCESGCCTRYRAILEREIAFMRAARGA